MRVKLLGMGGLLAASLTSTLLANPSVTEVVIGGDDDPPDDGWDGAIVVGNSGPSWDEVLAKSFERDRIPNQLFIRMEEDLRAPCWDYELFGKVRPPHELPSVFEMLDHNKPGKRRESLPPPKWIKSKDADKPLDPFQGYTEPRAKMRRRLGKRRKKK